MYRFNTNRRYNRRCNRCYNRPIVAPIKIKPVHSSLSYQQAIYHNDDRRGRQLPSGNGPLVYKTPKLSLLFVLGCYGFLKVDSLGYALPNTPFELLDHILKDKAWYRRM